VPGVGRESKAFREGEVYQKNDERVLGDGDFVGQVLNSAQEEMEKRYSLRSAGFDLGRVASRVSAVLGVKPEEVWAKGLSRRIVEARNLPCYWATVPSVSESVTRGERIAEARNCYLLET
jgi:hypothetical protein